MPEIDPVILQLRAEVKQYQNEIRATTTLVSNQLDRQERSIASLEQHVERSTGRISGSFRNMGTSINGYLAGFTAGVIIKELASLADQSKQLDAQLKLATNTFGTFGQAQADVRRIAEQTRGSLEATTTLYAGFVRASQETGRSQNDAARATQTFAQALKIGGASTAEAASATLQFNQALQSGVLRGDEFNSILEASPRIARLLADALNVPIGSLRNMAEQGQITSDVLFKALTDRKYTAGIDAEFRQIPVTFGDAMQAMENAAITTFGEFDKGGRFSEAIVTFLGTGTDTFEGLTSKAEEFGRDTRAVMDGLANVFDPILIGGNGVFDALGIRIYSVREQIGSLLDSFDRFANFDANIENSFKRGLNRAIDRAGGGQKFEMTPLYNTGGNFRAGARRSAAQSRVDAAARRLEGQGYIVPRNADGTVNEAGIVRRPATPRPSPTPRSSGAAKPSTRGGSRPARSRSSGAPTDDAMTAAEIIAGIRKDMAAIARDGGITVLTESEKLDRAARNFQGVFGREGKDYDDPFAGVADYDREQADRTAAMEDAERDAQYTREANVRSLADLYGDLFTRSTDDVWRNFKEQGLRNIALVLAQATIASFSSGGGGFSSLLGNIASAAGSAFGKGGGFGRASGGYVGPGQTVRVNEGSGRTELLRMGGQGGTVIPLGQTKAARPSSSTTVLQTISVDARGAVMNDQFASQILARAGQDARQVVNANNGAIRKSLPGAQARLNQLGTTG